MKINRVITSTLFVSMVFMTSCSENIELDESRNKPEAKDFYNKAYIETAELDEKLDYKNFHLTHLMEEVLRSKPDFEKEFEINSKDKGFSGGTTFDRLLGKVLNGKGESNDSIQSSLEAFYDIEGETLYPYVEKIKNGKGAPPLFLISSYDTEKQDEVVEGYELNDKGELVLTYENLSEEDVMGSETGRASNRSVYTLSIAACDELKRFRKTSCGSSSGGGSTVTYKGKIGYMIVKDKKESWLERAEIHRQSYITSIPRVHNGQDGVGTRMGKWKNRHIKKRRVVNHTFASSANQDNLSVVAYVIFENDHWPAHLRSYKTIVDGKQIKFRYRSYHPSYDERTISLNPSDPYKLGYVNAKTYSNKYIEYNVTTR